MGKPIGSFVQFAVRQLRVAANDGNRIRGAAGLILNKFVNALVLNLPPSVPDGNRREGCGKHPTC